MADHQRGGSGPLAVYASVGPELVHYGVDIEGAALTRQGSVMLPARVQCAWPHASGRYLYVASGERGPGSISAKHYVSAFRIDPASGALQPHGQSVSLPYRPIHITTDVPSEHVLIAYNLPSSLTVHRINRDATLGEEVKQAGPLDTGIFAHQIRVTSSNRTAILVTRGSDAGGGKPEDPGALKIFSYKDGFVTNRASIAPGGGYGFGARHLDFHRLLPWIFVMLERQNKLCVFKLEGDTLSAVPLFTKEILADAGNIRPRQLAGTLQVHPDGRFVYGLNRADGTVDFGGKRVFVGGENNIAVYAVNRGTGEPTLIQSVDTRGIYPRTFDIDPSGRLMVVANQKALLVKDGATVRGVSPNLAVFRIGDNGKLDYARKYDVDAGEEMVFWMGMVKP